MSKKKLLKAWYLLAFGLTGLFCLVVAVVGTYMSVQAVEQVQGTAHKDRSSDRACQYYFTYEVEGKQVQSDSKDYYTSRAGCRLYEGKVETIYYDPDNIREVQRTSNTFGLGVAAVFGLVALSCPLAIRKKWAELEKGKIDSTGRQQYEQNS